MSSDKIIRDPIHGNIKLPDVFDELIATPELQRLSNIKQLGFTHLVFPGAHHTRFEHSLGTYHVASRIAETLNLSEEEHILISSAALLHDIGHGPFSHTLESILLEEFGVDHVDLTEKLILGEYDVCTEQQVSTLGITPVHTILENHGIDAKKIADIIHGKYDQKQYLSQIMNSAIDADQMDYLIRDAYYTGVAYGIIDIDRILQTLTLHTNQLMIQRKGVSVIENVLMARGLMYTSVYFHKTVRIAELMLSRAIEQLEDLDPFEFYHMTDAEIFCKLQQLGGFQQEIASRLKYRRLFKQVYWLPVLDIDEDKKPMISELEHGAVRREKEQAFEETLGIPTGHIIIDAPFSELQRSEPRINKTDILVCEPHTIRPLDDYTPIATAIRERMAPDWGVMIITDEKYRTLVAENVDNILFS